MKKVILISGKAQHGKDSVADILTQKLPRSITLHFADTLKFYAQKYFGWNGEKTGAQRDLLQWLGTDRVRKEMGWASYWAERVCDVIEILEDKFDYFIVADCRFPNEISYPKERLKDFDIISVRVIRTNFDNGLTEEQQSHESEVALDCCEFDYVIESESGLDNLNYAILDFLKKLAEREV
jgi:hypothetical protein